MVLVLSDVPNLRDGQRVELASDEGDGSVYRAEGIVQSYDRRRKKIFVKDCKQVRVLGF